MAKVSVTLDVGDGVDPFSVLTSRPKRVKVRAFRAQLKRLLSGLPSRGTTRPTLRVGTAAASCTATLVTPVVGNHVDINAKAMTAALLHARAVATLVTPVATNSLTVQGVVFTAAQLHARGKVTFSTVVATNAVSIGGVNFVGAAGAATPGAATFSVDTSDTAAATSLAAQINAHAVASLVVGATSSGAVVKIRALLAGTAGNAIAFAKTGSPVTIQTAAGGALAGAFIEGGVAQTSLTWDYGDTDTQAAVSLAARINAHPTTVALMTASNVAGAVKLRSILTGTAGNAYTITKSGAPITITAAAGGADTGVFQDGAAASGDQWDYGDTDTQAAAALAACINRSTTALVTGVVTASSAAGVCTISAADKGLMGNTIAVVKTGSPITLAGITSGLITGGTSTTLTF